MQSCYMATPACDCTFARSGVRYAGLYVFPTIWRTKCGVWVATVATASKGRGLPIVYTCFSGVYCVYVESWYLGGFLTQQLQLYEVCLTLHSRGCVRGQQSYG